MKKKKKNYFLFLLFYNWFFKLEISDFKIKSVFPNLSTTSICSSKYLILSSNIFFCSLILI